MQTADRVAVAPDVSEEIGNTPVVDLSQFSPNSQVRLLAKLESHNPTGSVKDRVAVSLIDQAERDGVLSRGSGGVILEPTSGNTGIGLALIGRLRGYEVKVVMPESVSAERVQLLEGFGAEIIFSAAEKGTNESINVAKELAHENPSWFMPYQYGNRANPDAHYISTGPEIARDVPDVDMFVAGLGTGGTLMGVGRALREHNPEIKIVAAAPHPDDKVQGLRSIEHGFHSTRARPRCAGRSDHGRSRRVVFWTKKLLTDAGVFVGVSSGAVLASSIRAAKRLESGTIVMLFADGGWKYLSTGIYTRDWSDIQNEVEGQTWW